MKIGKKDREKIDELKETIIGRIINLVRNDVHLQVSILDECRLEIMNKEIKKSYKLLIVAVDEIEDDFCEGVLI